MVSVIVDRGNSSVLELADLFDVSQATVRRDLETLEERHLVSRTHGGATVHVDFNDIPLDYKTTENYEEKRRIAARAIEFIGAARVIGLTGGTTVTEFARLLHDREGLTVVTSALNIATDLAKHPGLRVFAAGGEVRSSSTETVGPSAESFVSGYNLDVVFLGVDGVDGEAGCTNYDPSGAGVNSALHARGQIRVVLADATKISRVALAQVCPMSEVDVLITDVRAPQAAIDTISEHGCKVLTV
jgi:DeoR family transcriptional regulator of aga operon